MNDLRRVSAHPKQENTTDNLIDNLTNIAYMVQLHIRSIS